MLGNEKDLEEVMSKFKVAMLVTIAPDGGLRGRPMAIQRREADQTIWLATSNRSDKVRDLESNGRCAVLFHDNERSHTYVSMSGEASMVCDRAKVRELWDPSWKLWFPEGPDEEDIVLLHFHPSHVEYADPTAGKLGVIVSAMKRLITKEHPPQEEKVQLDLP